jgi:hypothetical protein
MYPTQFFVKKMNVSGIDVLNEHVVWLFYPIIPIAVVTTKRPIATDSDE